MNMLLLFMLSNVGKGLIAVYFQELHNPFLLVYQNLDVLTACKTETCEVVAFEKMCDWFPWHLLSPEIN